MRIALLFVIVTAGILSCKKDKYTTAPQIKYKSLSENRAYSTNFFSAPDVILEITDAEGDLGINDSDTAFVYLKNLRTLQADSFPFPNMSAAASKNFKAELRVNLFRDLSCVQSIPRPYVDTFFFEIYVKDFEKNKSNTITTGDPLYYECQ